MIKIDGKFKDKFSQIPNKLITDNRLSYIERMILIYLLSKPVSWIVYNYDVMKQLEIKNEGTITKSWKNLEKTGWIKRTKIRNDKGHFEYDFIIYINNLTNTETETECNQDRTITSLGETEAGQNMDYSNTNISNTKHKEINNINLTSKVNPLPPKIEDDRTITSLGETEAGQNMDYSNTNISNTKHKEINNINLTSKVNPLPPKIEDDPDKGYISGKEKSKPKFDKQLAKDIKSGLYISNKDKVKPEVKTELELEIENIFGKM
jgi:predicted transcriptional regulator